MGGVNQGGNGLLQGQGLGHIGEIQGGVSGKQCVCMCVGGESMGWWTTEFI